MFRNPFPDPSLPIAGLVFLALTTACHQPAHQAEPTNDAASEDASDHPTHDPNDMSHDDAHGPRSKTIVELPPEAAARVEIRTAPVERRILDAELSTTGRVDFDETRLAHVSPRISGRVHRVHAILGQTIRPGEKLAEIDSIELGQAKAAFLQAKAKEGLARQSFERAERLLADQIAAEQTVLEAEAVFREAMAGLRTAEEILHLYGLSQDQVDTLTYDDREASIYHLRAPFAGTVVERHATLGELVTPERNLFTLADLGHLWIWIDVYQRDLARVHLEDRARARVDAFPDEIFEGKVSYLSAMVDADTRTIRARLDVANPEGKLRPGMFVQVELEDPHSPLGGETRIPGLVVPEEALVREGADFFVFVVAGERRFERRPVRVGQSAGGFVALSDGLAAGESVVVEGAFLLQSAASKESLGGGHDH